MNIPGLPTDNLYKFIALTGVFIFLLSVFYPLIKLSEIRDEITVIRGDVEKLQIERENVISKEKEFCKSYEDLIDKTSSILKLISTDSNMNSSKILENEKEINEFNLNEKNLTSKLNEEKILISLKSIDINTKLSIIKDKNNEIKSLTYIFLFFKSLGIILAIIGFSLWYELTQKFQDELLRSQISQFTNLDICQSCGMILSEQFNYTLFSEIEKKSIYCKICYNGTNFSEPEITLREMEAKVRKKCKELGFNKWKIYLKISQLRNLYRWRIKYSL